MKIAKCIFLNSEHKGLPSGKTQYDYFVPDHMKDLSMVVSVGTGLMTVHLPRQHPIHAVVLGGEGFYTVVRIVDVVELDKRNTRATKPLIALVDDTVYLAGKERQMRAQEIVQELKRMDRQHRAMERVRAIGATSPEAEALVKELDALSGAVPGALVVDFGRDADMDTGL